MAHGGQGEGDQGQPGHLKMAVSPCVDDVTVGASHDIVVLIRARILEVNGK